MKVAGKKLAHFLYPPMFLGRFLFHLNCNKNINILNANSNFKFEHNTKTSKGAPYPKKSVFFMTMEFAKTTSLQWGYTNGGLTSTLTFNFLQKITHISFLSCIPCTIPHMGSARGCAVVLAARELPREARTASSRASSSSVNPL
jgi:hypothetical protein